MRVIFWGTPDFAVPSLRAIDDEGFEVVAVVTQPDRPAGRGRRMKPSSVKQVALEMGVPVFTPDRPRTEDFIASIRALEADLSVVVAYGHILTREVLDVPALGSINVHASLLPELRGAAPINWAIARGHRETGVTIMRMAEAMDAGPIIHQVVEPLLADETAGDLTLRLSEVGAQALIEAMALLGVGAAEEVEQDHAAATFAPKIDRETARIDWARPAAAVGAHVRAMDPLPGAWTTLGPDPVKLFRPSIWSAGELAAAGGEAALPGTVVSLDPGVGVVVAANGGAVAFAEVQPPGRRRMEAQAWINGRAVDVGRRFD